jgi:hypothetical protein
MHRCSLYSLFVDGIVTTPATRKLENGALEWLVAGACELRRCVLHMGPCAHLRASTAPYGYRVVDSDGLALAHVMARPRKPSPLGQATEGWGGGETRSINRSGFLNSSSWSGNGIRPSAAGDCLDQIARSLLGISAGMGNCSRSNARPAGRCVTSISIPCRSDCPSACRCRRWLIISSAASVAPGMRSSSDRYMRGGCEGARGDRPLS